MVIVMVDYNAQTTLASPSVEINKIQILERRAYVIEALEKYYRYQMAGSTGETGTFKARVVSLFWELEGTLSRKAKHYEEYKKKIYSGKFTFEDCLEIWRELNLLLDQLHLTRVDTKKDYDSTDVEEENSVHGL